MYRLIFKIVQSPVLEAPRRSEGAPGGSAASPPEEPAEIWSGGNRLQQQIAHGICKMVLDEGLKAGATLNVSQISKTLNVSRTPVTAALDLMADQGLALKNQARGYRLASWDDHQRALVKTLITQDEVGLDVLIAEDRLSGSLPDEVTEAFLQRRYGVDRIALLNTLKELELDGLCHSKPGRGWIFEPSLDSAPVYRESYNFRKLIFSRCFFEPTYRFDQGRVDDSRRQHKTLLADSAMTPRAIAQCNAEFYETLAALSGNRFIMQATRTQNRIRRFRDYAFSWQRDRARLEAVFKSHMHILDLLEAGELEAASHAVWTHLDESEKLNSPSVAP